MVALASGKACAIDVFVDWDFAPMNMAAAWTDAGYGSGAELSPMEISSIIAMAEGKMAAKFAGYSVSFLGSAPSGDYEWMKLGATTTSTTTYGLSSGLDWRNRVKDGSVELYLANFGGILSSTLFTRSANIARFASAIANTASHELGHNLGLQHYDAYFVPPVTAPVYGFSGEQNGSIMATGVTGLVAMDRGHDRFFNPVEKLKLEFADEATATLGTTVDETVADKSTIGTAQSVLGVTMPISGLSSVNIAGKTSIPGQMDHYKIEAAAGSLLSANTLSHGHLIPFTDTKLTLLDSTGAALIFSDDIHFFGDTFMSPTAAYYSDDSLFFNFVAPYTGTYYLKVMGTAPGDYNLLVSGLSTVPEPASMIVVGLGLAAIAARRRKR